MDCVLAVEARVELAPRLEAPLADLPGFFAAVRLALPSDPPPDPFEPVVEPAAAPDDAGLAELLAVPDEPDEAEDCERAAALGGCGAGVGRMESSATRNHSLRPDAL